MQYAELPVTGYLDRFSHRPGESFTAYVSLRDGGDYRTRLVRVLSADPNPRGPGLRFQDLGHHLDLGVQGRRQEIRLGSYAVVERGPSRDGDTQCTWTVLVRPGRVDVPQVLIAEHAGEHRVTLGLGPDGVGARIIGPGSAIDVATGVKPRAGVWYRVWLSIDTST